MGQKEQAVYRHEKRHFISSRCRHLTIKSTLYCNSEIQSRLPHFVVTMSDKFLDRSLTKRENFRNPHKNSHRAESGMLSHPDAGTTI